MSDDIDIIGAPFYVMKRVEGDVLRTADEALALIDLDQVHLSEGLIDVLGDLHAIDPVSIGLGDFGKTVGFMQRQAKRWSRQLANSRSFSVVQHVVTALCRRTGSCRALQRSDRPRHERVGDQGARACRLLRIRQGIRYGPRTRHRRTWSMCRR